MRIYQRQNTQEFYIRKQNDIRYMKDYAEAFMDFFKIRPTEISSGRIQINEIFRCNHPRTTLGFPIYKLFNEDITFELLEDLHWKLKETHDASLVQSMQIFGEYR